MPMNSSADPPDIAVVIGASGGIGAALVAELLERASGMQVIGLSRRSNPSLDLLSEMTIERCANHVLACGQVRLLINATGLLHQPGMAPERSWQEIDPVCMAQAFAVNAIGPALLMKHFLPCLPKQGRAVFATLSARVGSIADNRLGGWYSYRASKAALNQLVRTAAIELRRRAPEAICVALHPGTVNTPLSEPFAKKGLSVVSPAEAARALLHVIDGLQPSDSGLFFDAKGEPIVW